MDAMTFAKSCFIEKERALDMCFNKGDTRVAHLIMQLDLPKEKAGTLKELLDTALVDTYMGLLYALDGSSCLGDLQ